MRIFWTVQVCTVIARAQSNGQLGKVCYQRVEVLDLQLGGGAVTKGEEEKVGKDDARHMSRLIMTEVIIQLGGVVIGQGFAGF